MQRSPAQFEERPAPRVRAPVKNPEPPARYNLQQRTLQSPPKTIAPQRRSFVHGWNDWNHRRHWPYPNRPFRHSTRVIFVGGFPVYYYPYGSCFYYGGHYYAYVTGDYSTPADYPTLYQLGYDWGQRIRDQSTSWADFVDYVGRYVVSSPEAGIDEFRDGFRDGYATSDADDVFARAFDEAGGNGPAE